MERSKSHSRPPLKGARSGFNAQFVLITGCSGGGKSTLVAALEAQGFAILPEPGRRVIADWRAGRGGALPWQDPTGFARQALHMARADLSQASLGAGPVFFDRGLIDAAVALEVAKGIPLQDSLAGPSPYAHDVFVAPPWPALFHGDTDRRHSFADAAAEHARIEAALKALGHQIVPLPRVSTAARVAFVLNHIQSGSPTQR